MKNTLLDNSEHFFLVDYLNDLIRDTNCNEICIATGYWDLKGTKLLYDTLLPFFERNGKLRLLIGQEPTIRSYQLNEAVLQTEKFPDFYIQRDVNQLTEEYAPVAQMLLKYANLDNREDSQIQIRVYGQKGDVKKFLHAKCYIFLGSGQAYGIIGSSNFTEKGLLDNAELNHLETIPNAVTAPLTEYNPYKTHLTWFNEMWNDESCEDWTGEFIKEILQKAPVSQIPSSSSKPQMQTLTPYEAYIRLLSDRFGKLVDDDMEAILREYLPHDVKPYKFQLDAAILCTQVMHQHGGFLLGDVVGLGKTIVGVLVLKYYLDMAEEEGRARKALIIVPPAIKSSWIKTLEQFDAERDDKITPYVDFVTTGSISKLMEGEDDELDEDTDDFDGLLKHEVYGLILIDESHNFRNKGTQKYEMLEDLIEEINLQAGYYPYMGLLSATIQNNSPEDLRNQIYLFQRHPKESTLAVEGHNLDYFFTQACDRYNKIIHEHPTGETEKQTNRAALIYLSKEIHDKVLAELLIRRTRTDIEKDYKEDLHFPKVDGPIPLEYEMNKKLSQLFYDSMRLIAPSEAAIKNGEPGIVYMRYRATEYLSNELKQRYSGRNMTPEKSSSHLARIMQILLVKRLESSFTAFRESLENLQRYTRNMITMWEDDCIFICPQIDVNAELNLMEKRKKNGKDYTIKQCYEDIRVKIKKLTKDGKNAKQQNAEYKRSDFNAAYYDLLVEDIHYIDELVTRWKDMRSDPKLLRFNRAIYEELFDKEKNKPQKLVVFSEAIATVDEIADALEDAGKRVLKITAANRNEKEQTIRANFDANYDGEWKDEYDAIVTTEVLAEGVNLHRANTILNYDTPWNSTRLIQRIGRVNRIGSVEDKVYVYNFFPSTEGNETINLTQRAFTKLQSFHTLFGEDNRIFMQEEEVSQVDYMKLMDGQETPYTKYIVELQTYKQKEPERFEYICSLEAPIISSFHADEEESLFVVKTDINNAGSVYVQVADNQGEIISCLDMFQHCICTEKTESAGCAMDEHLAETAILAYNTHVAKIYKAATSNNKNITNAKLFIREIISQQGLSNEAKQRLNIASRIMGKGDVALARKVCKLASQYHDIQLSLFEASAEDKMARISAIIENELKELNKKMIERNGEPYIYFCTNKVNK